MSDKRCDIDGCKNDFDQKTTGRGRITEKKNKGERVAWICPDCMSKISSKIEWRE